MIAPEQSPFSFFDGAFCITTSPRGERAQLAQEQFIELGIDVEVIESPKTDLYQEGCAIGHKKCVSVAKERGYKNVLIFEDVVLFINYDPLLLCNAIESLPPSWGLFFLGGIIKFPSNLKQESPNLLKTGVAENHAYAVNSTAFDEILNWKLRPKDHITSFHARLCECYLVNPIMAVQLDLKKPSRTFGAIKTFYRTKFILKKFN